MGSPRRALVLAALALALLLGALWASVRPGISGDVRAEATTGEAADGTASVSLEPGPEDAEVRTIEPAPSDPDAVPAALAAQLEKRYRGYAPDALQLARTKLGEALRVRADDVLREHLKTAGAGAPRPALDLAQESSTRELYLEIAWLEARLPKKERP